MQVSTQVRPVTVNSAVASSTLSSRRRLAAVRDHGVSSLVAVATAAIAALVVASAIPAFVAHYVF